MDLWFNKSVHVTSFTSRRVRFMSRTVLSDLLGFWFLYSVLVNYNEKITFSRVVSFN